MMPELAIAVSHTSQAEAFLFGRNPFQGKDTLSRYLAEIYKDAVSLARSKRITHLYWGNSFCQYRLPSINELKDAISFCESRNIEFVLMTPPLNDIGIAQCQLYLDTLQSAKKAVPIVVNDLGFLVLLKETQYCGEIIWGRVLDKTTRDVRMTNNERCQYYSASGYEYARSLASTAKTYQQTLSHWGVTRIQCDCASYPLVGGEMRYDMFYPTEYLTTGRMCLFQNAAKISDNQPSSMKKGCLHLCQDTMELLIRPVDRIVLEEDGSRVLSQKVVRYGNTLFCFHNNLQLPSQASRIVIDLDFSLNRYY